MLEASSFDIQQLDSKVNEGIRATDVVGMQNDGNCYVLLSQADKLAANDVLARLKKLGLNGHLVDTLQVKLELGLLVI
jgi:hypothetical protein